MTDKMFSAYEQIEALPSPKLTQFLGLLIHRLTIDGRLSYIPLSDDLEHPRLLRVVNEWLHYVAGVLNLSLSGDKLDRRLMINVFREKGQHESYGPIFQESVLQSLRLTDREA